MVWWCVAAAVGTGRCRRRGARVPAQERRHLARRVPAPATARTSEPSGARDVLLRRPLRADVGHGRRRHPARAASQRWCRDYRAPGVAPPRRRRAPAAAHLLLPGGGVRAPSTSTSWPRCAARATARSRSTCTTTTTPRPTSARSVARFRRPAARRATARCRATRPPASCASASSTATGAWTTRAPTAAGAAINNELVLLRELGCYADFTLPSAPSDTQTRTINSIYYATDDPLRPQVARPWRAGVAVGGQASGDLMIVQGPLALNWAQRRAGVGAAHRELPTCARPARRRRPRRRLGAQPASTSPGARSGCS